MLCIPVSFISLSHVSPLPLQLPYQKKIKRNKIKHRRHLIVEAVLYHSVSQYTLLPKRLSLEMLMAVSPSLRSRPQAFATCSSVLSSVSLSGRLSDIRLLVYVMQLL